MTQTNTKAQLIATERNIKENINQLKQAGMFPANIFGLNKDSIAISVSKKQFHLLMKEHGESSVIFLSLDKKEEPVMVDDISRHPLEETLQHVTFRRVDLKQKIEKEIPIEVIGEFDLPGATYVLVKDVVTVSALPEDFPESFEVDISKLNSLESSIVLSDLSFDQEKIKLITGDDEEPSEIQVVVVQELREENDAEETSVAQDEITAEDDTQSEAASSSEIHE